MEGLVVGPTGRPITALAEQDPGQVDIQGGRVVRLREFQAFKAEIQDLVVSGVSRFALSITLASPLLAADGTVALPGIAYAAQPGTGFSRDSTTGALVTSIAGAEKMRLISTGQLGLGMTPYANTLSAGSLDLVGGVGLFGSANNAYLSNNLYYSAGWKYKANFGGVIFALSNSDSMWFTVPTAGAVADAAAAVTERMRLSEFGHLTIGAGGPPALHDSTYQTLHFPGRASLTAAGDSFCTTNVYYQGGSYKRIAIGYGSGVYMGGAGVGGVYLYNSVSAAANSTVSWLVTLSATSTGITVSVALTSTVSTGTAPFVVASTTLVTNLNADLLDGVQGSAYTRLDTATNSYTNTAFYYEYHAAQHVAYYKKAGGPYSFYWRKSTSGLDDTGLVELMVMSDGGQLSIPVATGTAPLAVNSTTLVTNLNSDLLDGLNSATAATASTIAARDSAGDLYANVFQANAGSASNPAFSFGVDGNTGMYRSAAEELAFATQGTARAWINNNGVGAGLAPTSRNNCSLQTVNGLGFPSTQVASSDANVLDDYEEGTWTPALGGTTTYTVNPFGTYTKIGRRVHVDGNIYVAGIGTGSTTTVSGLPFTAAASRNYSCQPDVIGGGGLASNVVSIVGYIPASGTTLIFLSFLAAGAAPGVNALFGNNTYLDFSGSYDI